MRPRVPPGQVVTHGWPVLHAGTVPTELTPDGWDLTIHGEVDRPQRIDYAALLTLPQTELVTDVHCVTSWTRQDMRWKGVQFRAIADAAGPKSTAKFVVMECEQGFTTSLPYEALRDADVLLAHSVDGNALPPEHGGPVRMLVPKRYFYKSAKWIRGLKFVGADEPGFWEVRGYSNVADPWEQTRYTVDDVRLIHRMRKQSLFHDIGTKDEPGDRVL
ncbi:MAG: molybdopterin-dependent oxidoreductase [Thermoplasmata archaeon]|nr:molybdopterin-dependent oxidoreductase [Thermoplasmata archaeon]